MEPTEQLLPATRLRAHSVNLLEYSDGRLMATLVYGHARGE